jgi:hypothetical protein
LLSFVADCLNMFGWEAAMAGGVRNQGEGLKKAQNGKCVPRGRKRLRQCERFRF